MCKYIIVWLVVYPPLWKMMEFVSWGDDIPNWMDSHKNHLPNHQPDSPYWNHMGSYVNSPVPVVPFRIPSVRLRSQPVAAPSCDPKAWQGRNHRNSMFFPRKMICKWWVSHGLTWPKHQTPINLCFGVWNQLVESNFYWDIIDIRYKLSILLETSGDPELPENHTTPMLPCSKLLYGPATFWEWGLHH